LAVLALTAVAACGCDVSARAGPGAGTSRAPLLVGFYDAWDQSDLPALPRQLAGLDVFSPRWLTIRGAQGQVVAEPDPGAAPLAAKAGPRLKLMPLVSNAHDDIWDQAAADAVILEPEPRKAFLGELVRIAAARGYAGYVLDFENLSPRARAGYPALVAAARAALAPSGREAWATVAPGPDEPLQALASAGDAAVLMAYDECWATSNAGPIAGADWLRRLLSDRLAGVDPRHVVVALAAYGYDWPDGAPGQPIGAAQAMRLAQKLKVAVQRDPASRNAHFAAASGLVRRRARLRRRDPGGRALASARLCDLAAGTGGSGALEPAGRPTRRRQARTLHGPGAPSLQCAETCILGAVELQLVDLALVVPDLDGAVVGRTLEVLARVDACGFIVARLDGQERGHGVAAVVHIKRVGGHGRSRGGN
jgi:hypothetical protein